MNILVITFCRGLNPGTFMQALGVRTGLLQIFPEANIDYLNFPDFKRGLGGVFGKKDSLKDIFLQKSSAIYRKIKYRRLEKKYFPKTKPIDLFAYDDNNAREIISSYDLVVVGSDTILEKAVDDKGNIGLNWLRSDLCCCPRVFFAASASPARFEIDEELKSNLKKIIDGFSYIGLRDNLSIKLFEKTLGVESTLINKQPDPTFFLDVHRFKLGSYYEKKLLGKKVALYNFSAHFPYKREFAAMLKAKGYYVVATGYCPDIDLCINTIDATEWAGVFNYVTVVVTERFHDSVFSLRNEKPVVAIDWEKERFSDSGDSKTYRILEDYDMLDYHYHVESIDDLKPIAEALNERVASFDKAKVAAKNKEMICIANSLLNKVKVAYENNIKS